MFLFSTALPPSSWTCLVNYGDVFFLPWCTWCRYVYVYHSNHHLGYRKDDSIWLIFVQWFSPSEWSIMPFVESMDPTSVRWLVNGRKLHSCVWKWCRTNQRWWICRKFLVASYAVRMDTMDENTKQFFLGMSLQDWPTMLDHVALF